MVVIKTSTTHLAAYYQIHSAKKFKSKSINAAKSMRPATLDSLQDSGEGLPVLVERPLILCAGGVVVVHHLRELLPGKFLVLGHVRDHLHSPAQIIHRQFQVNLSAK